MTNEEKAQEIYNIIYKQCVEDGYHEKITTACAIMGKAGAEIMGEWKDEQFDKFISSMGLVVKDMYEQYKERRQPLTDNKSTLYLLQNPEFQKELYELANKLSVSFIGKEMTFNTPTCQVTFKFN